MSEYLGTIVMVIVMWFGGQLVLGGKSVLTAEEFIGYILIFSQIIPPAKSLTSSYYYIQKGSASAKRIYEVLDSSSTIKDNKNAIEKKFSQSVDILLNCAGYAVLGNVEHVPFCAYQKNLKLPKGT